MSPRTATRLAWSLCGLSVALAVVGVVMIALTWSYRGGDQFSPELDVALTVALLAFPVVGALVASRRPENSIGWLFCAVGVVPGLEHGQQAIAE